MNSRFVLLLWVGIVWHSVSWAQGFSAKKTQSWAVPGSVRYYASGQIESLLLAKNQMIQGVLAQKGSLIQFHPAGGLKNATLAAQQTLAGYQLQAQTQVKLYDNQVLYSGTLARAKKFHALSLPAGSVINLNKKGALLRAIVPAQTKIFGLSVAGDFKQRQLTFFRRDRTLCVTTSQDERLGDIEIPHGSQVYFDYAGVLDSLVLSEPITLSKITFCKQIRFYNNQQPAQGWLPFDQNIAGLRFDHRNHPLQFYPNGKPKEGQIAQGQTLAGLRLRDHTIVSLHENGKLAQAALQHAQPIGDITFSGQVTFYPNGQIKEGFLPHTQQIRDLSLRGKIEFFPDGQPFRVILASDTEIDSVPCQAQYPVEFLTNQKLRTARLSRRHRIQGCQLKAGSVIQLHPNGALAYGRLDKPKQWGTQTIPDGIAVRLTTTGELANPHTKTPWSIAQLVLPRKTRLFTDSVGKLVAAQPGEPLTVFSVPVSRQGFVLFDNAERAQGIILDTAQLVFGTRFPSKTKLFFDRKGRLASAVLSQDQRIRGIFFSAGEPLAFHASGRPKHGRLAADWGPYKRDQKIELYENGQPVRDALLHDEVISGLHLRTGDVISRLYPQGSIKTLIPISKRRFDDVWCKSGLAIWLHPNGKLKRCYLAKESEVQGLFVRDEVELFETGKLAKTFLACAQRIAHIEYSPDEISFYPNGVVREGRLAKKQEIEGRLVEALSKVVFGKRGQVLQVEPFILPY